MRLSDFLAPAHMVVPLQHDSITSVAGELIDRLVAAGAVSDAAKLQNRVAEERAEDIVAMGERAFLLHYRTDAVTDLRVALGTAERPICRELGENESQCARVVLLIVAPPRMAAEYLQLVSAFARLLSKQAVVDQLLQQRDAASLATLPPFAEYELPTQLTVRDIMTERPRTIEPDQSLRDAARMMVRLGIGALPVVDGEGLLIGMLGERELLRALASDVRGARGGAAVEPARAGGAPTRTQVTVREAMNRQVLCVSPDQPLADVTATLTNKDVDRVPVVRDGRIVGMLTRGDIVRKLLGY